MGPKLPKPQRKKKENISQELKTADDYLNAGTDEEDSGDRWIKSGDVPKGVRFYQRAFRYYLKVIELATTASEDQEIANDSKYNMARIQYVVYTSVVKPKLLLKIQDKLEPNDPGLIVMNIETVAANHEQTINQTGGQDECLIDLLYNYAQVLSDCGEEVDKRYYQNSSSLFTKCYQRQVKEQFPPVIILETMISNLRCCTAMREEEEEESTIVSNSTPNSNLENIETQLISEIDRLITEIGQDDDNNCINTVNDGRIAVAQYLSTINNNDQQKLMEIWENGELTLPCTAQRYMAQADAFISASTWTCLSQAAKSLQQGLNLNKSNNTNITDTVKLWIAKGDVEWLRSNVNSEVALKNQNTLRSNARVFYTNGLNTLKRTIVADGGSELPQLKREGEVKINVLDSLLLNSKSYSSTSPTSPSSSSSGWSLDTVLNKDDEDILAEMREDGLL